MPQWKFSEQQATLISLGLLFVFGLRVPPCYYIPASVFSIDFGGPHSGFLVAILDAVGFAASAVFTVSRGHIAQAMLREPDSSKLGLQEPARIQQGSHGCRLRGDRTWEQLRGLKPAEH